MIREAGASLRDLFQEELADIATGITDILMGRARRLDPSQRYKATSSDIPWPGENAYRANVLDALALIALESLNAASKEVPKAKVKYAEELENVSLADDAILDRLPPPLRNKIKKRAELLVGTQLADLQKTIFFQYQNSFETTEDLNVVNQDIKEATVDYIGGTSISAGADLTAATIVNEARSAFFMEQDVLDELDAFVFTNGDPVTPVCIDLNGTVFAKDDPNMFRYTPPLHWNCKSYILPILKGNLNGRKVETLKPSTKALDDSVQFMEHLNIARNSQIHSH